MATEYKLSYTAKEIDAKLGQIAQADWAVNDETSGAYVKNRTHWVESSFMELLPATTVECPESEGAITQPIGLEVGGTYTVTWNGTEYECVAVDLTSVLGASCAAVGDWKLVTTEGAETTGEPFVVIELFGEAAAQMGVNAMVYATDGSTAPIVSIIWDKRTYHKLDKNFIPEIPPFEIYFTKDAEDNVICNRTYDDILKAIINKKVINIQLESEDAILRFTLSWVDKKNGQIIFVNTMNIESVINIYCITINSDNTITITTKNNI